MNNSSARDGRLLYDRPDDCPTPRTDAECEIRCVPHDYDDQIAAIPAELGRQLERENAELREAATAALERLEKDEAGNEPGYNSPLVHRLRAALKPHEIGTFQP